MFQPAILLMIPAVIAAPDHRDRYEARTFTAEHGGQLPYRLLKPKGYDKDQAYPLVLFLHGAGERGTDNQKQLIHGLNEFAQDEMLDKYPCFIVAPQCPDGKQWVDTPWSADSHTMAKEPTEPLRQSLELLQALQKEFSIDSKRLYVTGLSMGGFGVW